MSDGILADLSRSYGEILRSLIVTSSEPSPVTLLWVRDSSDGVVRVRVSHRCDRGARGVIICAPHLTEGEAGHVVTFSGDVPTITPSIACDDCGLHGYVTSGRWVPA